ncbi:MAG: molybdenum cofactor guanylyltransferase [Candidatus Eisenbacteria bacterium]|nr:molybdenum cofactor guanylyltransferase [Candidatus Eisenbacteria bacterium]
MSIPPAQIAAIILCGGQSRRFGADKAIATRGGRTFLQRAIDCAGTRADEVILACGPVRRYEEFGRTLALDPPEVTGPLAGMLAGLAQTERPYILFLAVDLADATPAALDQLIEAMVTADPPVDLVMPESERGPEPLLTLGRRAPLALALRALSTTAVPAPRLLVHHLTTRMLTIADDPTDPLRRAITNINTPADLDTPPR